MQLSKKALRNVSSLGRGREIRASELAQILCLGGNRDVKRAKAIRWLKRRNIGKQDPSGYWYTTIGELRTAVAAEQVYDEALRRGHEAE